MMDKKDELGEHYRVGEELYRALTKHANIQFIVCPASLGDTVNIGAFVGTYKRVHNKEKVILVVKEHQVSLGRCFTAVDDIISLSEGELICLRLYITLAGMQKEKNVLYGYFPAKEGGLWETANSKNTCFVDEYKSMILDIPPDSAIDEVRIQDTDDHERFTGSILLIPFCLTYEQKFSDNFWQNLVDYYRRNGVKEIYTNIGNPGDYALEGTQSLSLSVSELLSYSSQFEKIIGVRGGIFDVLALRDDVRLDVITPYITSRFWGKCEIDTIRHPLYYGLKNLNPNAKVREYSFSEGCESALLKEITDPDAKY